MSKNFQPSLRYRVIDTELRKRSPKCTMEYLIEKCNQAIREADANLSPNISERTFRDDIRHMKAIAKSVNAKKRYECSSWKDVEIQATNEGSDKFYYRYSKENFSIFDNDLLDAETKQLKEAVSLLSRFKGLSGFTGVERLIASIEDKFDLKVPEEQTVFIDEVDDYIGFDWFSDLHGYIEKKQTINIEYRTFSEATATYTVSPYILREYNNRWFLLGQTEEQPTKLTSFALDRIDDVSLANHRYIPNTRYDLPHYFDNVIGVSVNSAPVQHIRMKVAKEWIPYMETKKIHSSWKREGVDSNVFSIDVQPNNELDAVLLSFGPLVEILEPLEYRERIHRKIKDALNQYE